MSAQPEIVRWLLEYTFNGDEKGDAVYESEAECRASAERDGGVCVPLIRAALSQQAPVSAEAPINMVLHCPACSMQHIDKPAGQFYPGFTAEESVAQNKAFGLWDNPPHRTHLCHGCGHKWRPADVATNGVEAVKTKGKDDSQIIRSSAQVAVPAEPVAHAWFHRGMVNFDAADSLALHDDGKGTPIDLYLAAPVASQVVPAEPVAWRVRGYGQFRKHGPGNWLYVDGSAKPDVNAAAECDLEPLYLAAPAVSEPADKPPVDEDRLRSTDDASVWADEFSKVHPEIDRGLMIGWFANCAEGAKDLARWRSEAAAPSAPIEPKCPMCRGTGRYGMPGKHCEWCDGKGAKEWGSPIEPTPTPRIAPNSANEKAWQNVFITLSEVPCNCSKKRRDEGEHLSGCHLFDLQIALDELSATAAPIEPTPPAGPVTADWCSAFPKSSAYIINQLSAREESPELTDSARNALLWVLWHHQGSRSLVGQAMRFALGMGQHDRLSDDQVDRAKRYSDMGATPPAEQGEPHEG